MKNEDTKQLCLNLMQADYEDEVIKLLKDAGYWDNPDCWRVYGDDEGAYSTIGNQQNTPEAALVEKLVNSVDATLLRECRLAGTDPEDVQEAPRSIGEAVDRYFGNGKKPEAAIGTTVREWGNPDRLRNARTITLAVTGSKTKNPCFTIADQGEGQTPRGMPDTLLSIKKANKAKIPFVQGKFNMGATGALEFCGKNNLQLVISRRHPKLIDSAAPSAERDWSFTVVRREDPPPGYRTSIYRYLTPLPGGHLLHFPSEKMPILAEGNNAYKRESEWGTLVKLYEYNAKGFRTGIFLKGGLVRRLDLLLPNVALPVRVYECRYKIGEGSWKAGSFEWNLLGIGIRLDDDASEKLEDGFPVPATLNILGEKMQAEIYAFKPEQGETFKGRREGVLFVVNGQTHGVFPNDFFGRKSVKMDYLQNDLLVIVDCSKIGDRARELLFMNSRDRLRVGELEQALEEELASVIKNHDSLRILRQRRQQERLKNKLSDSKPLKDVLSKLLKKSPTLSTLFIRGTRIPTPFKSDEVDSKPQEYKSKWYPSYFKFKGHDYGHVLKRDCNLGTHCKIEFESDAPNDYLKREKDPGTYELTAKGLDEPLISTMVPQNGLWTLQLQLPESANIGDVLEFETVVNDASRTEPFKNTFRVTVKEKIKAPPRSPRAPIATERTKPPASPTDEKKKKEEKPPETRTPEPPTPDPGTQRDFPAGVDELIVEKVKQEDWSLHGFNEHTALVIKGRPIDENDPDSAVTYDFFVNVDNRYLKHELKYSKQDPALAETRFVTGLVLVGLGLLQDHMQRNNGNGHKHDDSDDTREISINDHVAAVSAALAPIMLPMITDLGELGEDDET